MGVESYFKSKQTIAMPISLQKLNFQLQTIHLVKSKKRLRLKHANIDFIERRNKNMDEND